MSSGFREESIGDSDRHHRLASQSPWTRPADSAKLLIPLHGEMSEWLKEHAWKACVGETLPWVRIPLSPPVPLITCEIQHFSSSETNPSGDPATRPTATEQSNPCELSRLRTVIEFESHRHVQCS